MVRKREFEPRKPKGRMVAPERASNFGEVFFAVSPELRAAGTFVETELAADFGTYPADHPVSQYVNEIFNQVIPTAARGELKVLVTRGWDSANACALPNGTIIISDRMLQFCESAEEIQFVLRHEYKHIEREHSQKSRTAKERTSAAKLFEKVKERLGQGRLHEYEADLASVTGDQAEVDFNMLGGIRFIERLVADERKSKSGGGLVHGGSMDRLLNLHLATRLVDSKSLSHDLTPIPSNIVACLRPGQSFSDTVLVDVYGKKDPGRTIAKIEQALKNASFEQASLVVGELCKRTAAAKERAQKGKTDSLDFKAATLEGYTKIALRRFKLGLSGQVSQIKGVDRAAVKGLLAAFVYDVPVHEANEEDSITHADFQDFFDFFEEAEDFERLPYLIEQLGDKPRLLKQSPGVLLGRIIQAACETELFESEGKEFDLEKFCAYSERLVAALSTVYPAEMVTGGAVVYTRLSAEALLNFEEAEVPETIRFLANRLKINAFDIYRAAKDAGIVKVNPKNEREYLVSEVVEISEETQLWSTVGQLSNQYLYLKQRAKYLEHANLSPTGIAEEQRKILELLRQYYDQFRWLTVEDALSAVQRYVEQDKEDTRIDDCAAVLTARHDLILTATRLPNPCTKEEAFRYALLLNKIVGGRDPIDSWNGLNGFLHLIQPEESREAWRSQQWQPGPGDLSVEEVHMQLFTTSDKNMFGTHYEVDDVDLQGLWAEYFFASKQQELNRLTRSDFFSSLRRSNGIQPRERSATVATELVNAVFEKYTFDLNNSVELDELLTLTAYIQDFELANRLQERIVTGLFATASTQKLEDVLFRDNRTKNRLLLEVRTRFVEERLQTPEELKAAVQEVAKARVVEDEGLQNKAGESIMVLEVLKHMLRKPLEVITSGLDTSTSDWDIKKLLLNLAINFQVEIAGLDGPNRGRELPNLNIALERLYSMEEITKRGLIRQLLVGEHGLLFERKDLEKFIDQIFNRYLLKSSSADDADLHTGLHETLKTAARIADPATLYFMLEPFLFERLWKRPPNQSSWEEVLKEVRPEHEHEIDTSPGTLQAIVDSVSGSGPIELEERTDARYQSLLNRLLFDHVEHYAPTSEKKVSNRGAMTAVEFIKLTAGQLGAPGVRLLQVVGQYLPMSPELEKSFVDVYDSVPGQSKLSAYHTLEREWPEIGSEVTKIGKTIGGGSLATVWDMTTANGAEVVKVLNPNAEFFVDSMCDILERTFQAMEATYPTQARLGVLAIRDIRQWLHADITYERFLERDAEFKTAHQGFTLDGTYTIHIPKSYGKDSPYYKREEKIEGTNLTKLSDLRDQGHDLKAITQLLVMDVVQQIGLGRMHSDVHPGNIRITSKKEVVILDRNFYIDLEPAEQSLIMQLVTSDNPRALLLDFFMGLPENASVDLEAVNNLIDQKQIDLASPEGAAQLISAAKQGGMYIPLKVTILVKNFLALNKLSRDAGFSSLRQVVEGG